LRKPADRALLATGLLLMLALFTFASTARAQTFSIQFDDGRSDIVQTMSVDGDSYFRLADLARAFGASRHWNPRTSKMSLAVGIHRLSMASGSQFVTLDSGAMNVGSPVLLREGEYWVPERFLSTALALAVNSEIGVSSIGSVISVVKLGAMVTSLDMDERAGNSVAILDLNDRADFAVSSRNRGRVDVFLPGASMADSLLVLEGTGLVTSITAERTEAGVNAVIRVAPSATSYEAQMHTDPPRLEVTVASERHETVPSPLLKGTVSLLGTDTTSLDLGRGVTTIMLDPGHGGTDSGRMGLMGLVEKDVTLMLANEIAVALRREGFIVFMTRSSDSYVGVKRRAEIANLAGADLFISVHCGAWHSGAASGHRVTYYSRTEDYLVDKNRAGGRGLKRGSQGARRGEVEELVWGEVQEGLADRSVALARVIDRNLSEALPNNDRGVGSADVAVLAGCAMPAVMVEAAFITSPSDADLLSDPDFRESVGRAVASGVVEYARSAEGRRQ
jgi:N-acetylmuramoyl-L-alanine amidase